MNCVNAAACEFDVGHALVCGIKTAIPEVVHAVEGAGAEIAHMEPVFNTDVAENVEQEVAAAGLPAEKKRGMQL